MTRRKIPGMRPEGTVNSGEAADLLGVARATFFRYRHEPDFPEPIQVGRGGRQALYRAADLIAWRDRRIAGAAPFGAGTGGPSDSTN